MDAKSHEDWSVRRLARVGGVSEAHFARSFKQAFGVPPHRYLLTRRIERATALLRDTDLAITEGSYLRSATLPCLATGQTRRKCYRYFTHFLGIKGAGHGQILADAESPEPGACE